MVEVIISGLVGLMSGLIIGRYVISLINKKELKATKLKANEIIKVAEEKAENIKKEKVLEGKERFLQMKTEFEQKAEGIRFKIKEREDHLRREKEEVKKNKIEVNKKEYSINNLKDSLNEQLELVSIRKKELDKVYGAHIKELEKVSQFSSKQAKSQLIELLKEEAKTEAISFINTTRDEAKLKANKEAKKILMLI